MTSARVVKPVETQARKLSEWALVEASVVSILETTAADGKNYVSDFDLAIAKYLKGGDAPPKRRK